MRVLVELQHIGVSLLPHRVEVHGDDQRVALAGALVGPSRVGRGYPCHMHHAVNDRQYMDHVQEPRVHQERPARVGPGVR